MYIYIPNTYFNVYLNLCSNFFSFQREVESGVLFYGEKTNYLYAKLQNRIIKNIFILIISKVNEGNKVFCNFFSFFFLRIHIRYADLIISSGAWKYYSIFGVGALISFYTYKSWINVFPNVIKTKSYKKKKNQSKIQNIF